MPPPASPVVCWVPLQKILLSSTSGTSSITPNALRHTCAAASSQLLEGTPAGPAQLWFGERDPVVVGQRRMRLQQAYFTWTGSEKFLAQNVRGQAAFCSSAAVPRRAPQIHQHWNLRSVRLTSTRRPSNAAMLASAASGGSRGHSGSSTPAETSPLDSLSVASAALQSLGSGFSTAGSGGHPNVFVRSAAAPARHLSAVAGPPATSVRRRQAR